jgi:hypothetical protein
MVGSVSAAGCSQWPGNIEAEIMQNLQVLNSFCSFEIPDIFLFETRFKK